MRRKFCPSPKQIIASVLIFAMLFPICGCKKEDAVADKEPMVVMKEDAVADKEPMVVMNAADAITQLAAAEESYGYENALSELTEKHTTTIDGDSYYRLQQNYQGIPVYGRSVVCATDQDDTVSSLTGNILDISDDIDLTPEVTEADVAASINAYFLEDLGYIENVEIGELSKDDLCIYNLSDTTPRLAYCIKWGCYDFVVDAVTSDVLHACSTIQDVTVDGYKASDIERKKPFKVEKYGDTEYVLENADRKVAVMNLNHIPSSIKSKDGSDIYQLDRALRVVSSNNVFGDEYEAELGYEDAVTLLDVFLKMYDYFSLKLKVAKQSQSGEFILYYNDGYQDGGNARGGDDDAGNGVLIMGAKTGVTDIDVIAHEYTHIITRANVEWTNATIQNYALNEAYSDIFGVLIERWYSKKYTPTWLVDLDYLDYVLRNIANPSKTNNAASAYGIPDDGRMNRDEILENGYKYSTVISHAAYLMWNGIDGTESKKISTDDLAKLWYRAMLMMPSDCDFNDCRQLVELAATSMKFTTTQIECVREAFDEVGITKATKESFDALYDLVPNSTLSVYGGDRERDGELYDNYTLNITGNTTIYGPVIEKVDGSYNRTITITDAKPYVLNLPEGIYIFTITDNANPNDTRTFTVCVQNDDGDTNIDIFTNFGCTPIKGTVSEMKVLDGVETNVPINNAVVTIISHSDDTVVETINMAETEGFFEDYLPIGNYTISVTAEGYIGQAISFELKDSELYLPIVLQPEKQQKIVDLANLVTDAYVSDYTSFVDGSYSYTTGKSMTGMYRIPQINLSHGDVERINQEIYNSLHPMIEESVADIKEYGYPGRSGEIEYNWAVNGDILSLVIRNFRNPSMSGWDDYTVYNISIESGLLISDTEVVTVAGFSEGEFKQRAKEVLGSSFWRSWSLSDENFEEVYFVNFFNEQLRRTLSDDNIADVQPYINEKGQLCIIGRKYSLAAGDSYLCDLNMIDFKFVDYYADEAKVLS